jgi:hypothetical protein
MKAKRLRLLLIAIALVSVVATYNVLAWHQEPASQVTNSTRPAETNRNAMINNQLRSLLGTVGVSVGDTPPVTSDHRRVTVHWQSSTDNSKSLLNEQPKGSGVLTATSSLARPGSVPVPRTLELATTHTLVIGVDESQQLLWWNQFPDPRILRAEVPDASGQQHIGRTFYRSETDFTVAYPNNPAINELRFYHPLWNGTGFELELIGSVSVK